MSRYLTDAELDKYTPPAGAAPAPVAPKSRYLSDAEAGIVAAPARAPNAPAAPPTIGQQLARQLGLTARDAMTGVAGAAGTLYDPLAYLTQLATGKPQPTAIARANQAADALGLPKPQGTAESYINNAAAAAAGGAGMASVAGSVANRTVAPLVRAAATQMAAAPAGQVAGAATGSMAAQAADDQVAQRTNNPIIRAGVGLLAGTGGGMPGAGLATKMQNGLPTLMRGANGRLQFVPGQAATAAQQSVIDTARANGVPLRAGDVGGAGGWWNSIENGVSKYLPFSSGIPTATARDQVAGVRGALSNTAASYAPAGVAPGSDATQFIANDLRNQYRAAKGNTSQAFNRVSDLLAANPGADAIQLPQTARAANDLLAQYPNVFTDLSVNAKVKPLLQQVAAGTAPQNSTILQPNGQPFQVPPSITYGDARELSKALGQAMNQSKRQAIAGNASDSQTAMLTRVYHALNGDGTPGGGGDIGDWAQNAPAGIGQAHYDALDAYRTQVQPFKNDPTIHALVSTSTPRTDYDLAAQGLTNNLFNGQQSERAPYALSLMSPQGRQASAYQALQNAADTATSANSASGLYVGKGLKKLDLDNPALGSIMDANSGMADDVSGLRSMLDIGRRANDLIADPKTGARTLPIATAQAAAMGGAGAAHFAGVSPWMGGVGALVGAPILGNGIQAASRYLPKEALFASSGSGAVNAAGGALGSQYPFQMPSPDDDMPQGLLQ